MGFDESALNYFYSSDHKEGEDLEFCKAYFKGFHFDKLLDVASATGHFAAIFNSRVKVLLDMSLNMLKTAKNKYNFHYLVKSDAHSLPFKDEIFDIVTCRIALHHFKNPSLFFDEVERVLKAKGYFVLIDSIVDVEEYYLNAIEKIRDKTHIKSRSIGEIISFAKGFRLLSFHTVFKRHNFEEWAKRLNPDDKTFEDIRNAFVKLPCRIKKELKLKTDGDKIISYTDKKGIFIFSKIGGRDV